MLEKLERVPVVETEWAMRVYAESFLLCPGEWCDFVSSSVLEFIEPVTESVKEQLRRWN